MLALLCLSNTFPNFSFLNLTSNHCFVFVFFAMIVYFYFSSSTIKVSPLFFVFLFSILAWDVILRVCYKTLFSKVAVKSLWSEKHTLVLYIGLIQPLSLWYACKRCIVSFSGLGPYLKQEVVTLHSLGECPYKEYLWRVRKLKEAAYILSWQVYKPGLFIYFA